MLRILQIGMTPNAGGIETFVMNYYRNIDKKEIQYDFINIYDKQLKNNDEIISLGGKIYKTTSYYKRPFKYMKELKKIINDGNYEIIHCNMSSAVFLWPLIAAKQSKAKIVIAHAHNSLSDKGVIKAIIHKINKRFIPLFANRFVYCSSKAGEWFFSKRIRKSKRYIKLNNAIDIDKFLYNEETRKKIRKANNIKDTTLVIGHVGRFVKVKNHTFLIDIFHSIKQKQADSKLILIGDGELEQKIKEKVANLNLQDDVLFIGTIDNVNEYMQAIDAFIFPSITEGLPFVGVEAQASGVNFFPSDSITKELNISKNINYISLDLPAEKWADIILKTNANTKRIQAYAEVSKNGFNIKDESIKLKEIYTSMLKGEI